MTTQPTNPPRLHVTAVIAALSPAEIALNIGHHRFMLFEQAGSPDITHHESFIEWVATLTMSPTTAVTIYTIMGHTLMKYRELFGEITEDQALLAKMNDAIRMQSPSVEVN